MPITTQAIQAKTPNNRRKNNLMPDIALGLGSSTWSLGDVKNSDEGWMSDLSSDSLPSGRSSSYNFMDIMSCWSDKSPVINDTISKM